MKDEVALNELRLYRNGSP